MTAPAALAPTPVQNELATHGQEERCNCAGEDDGDHVGPPARHRMAHHPGQVRVNDKVGDARHAPDVAVIHPTERVPGMIVEDEFGNEVGGRAIFGSILAGQPRPA